MERQSWRTIRASKTEECWNNGKKHFNPDLETRIKCDASREGLACALEQRTPKGWHIVAFASRFLNSVEDRYSINELELLDVVWSIEHFKYYLFGKTFTVITDHRALLSVMRENRANRSHNSRLTRCVDRLLPFDFITFKNGTWLYRTRPTAKSC